MIDHLKFKYIGENVHISNRVSIYNPENITIGNNVRIDDFSILSGGIGLEIGSHIHIAAGVKLFAGAGIKIQDFAQISVNTTIMSQSDDFSGNSLIGPCIPLKYKPGLKSSSVLICRHVIVGAGCFIMPGVILNEGVAIGANSVVKKSCNAWKIFAGIPAKFICNREKMMLELEKIFLEEYKKGRK